MKQKPYERTATILLYYAQQKCYLNRAIYYSKISIRHLKTKKFSGASEAPISGVHSSGIFDCTNYRKLKVIA